MPPRRSSVAPSPGSIHDEGLLFDVASGGELHVVLSAGVPAASCVMHGNNKSIDELRLAITAGVRRIVVDSFDELDRLDSLHGDGLAVPDVLLRVTPGVHAHTHTYIATGQNDSKFGFNLANGDAERAARRAQQSSSVNLVGFHCHIGSNVFVADSFAKAAGGDGRVRGAVRVCRSSSSVGASALPTSPPSRRRRRATGPPPCSTPAASAGVTGDVSVEPGRALVAAAAVTLYTVGTIKRIPGVRTYIAVDGGMSDNPRPVLYGSGYEAMLPRSPLAERPRRARLVGKHCESGDILIFDAHVPADIAVGDVVAVPVTGAYGHSMGSNYNKVPRPAIVFADAGDARIVVRRETYDDLLLTDVG